MLDQLDLVHMNGRVYDPTVARFMSADPIIQDPTHSQSYNRYTYVWNNPTNLTDPTGFRANGQVLRAQTPAGDRHSTHSIFCDANPGHPNCKTNSGDKKVTETIVAAGTADVKEVEKTKGGEGSASNGNGQLVQNPADPNCKVGPCLPADQIEKKSLVKQTAIGSVKVVTGAVSAVVGGGMCTTLFGCAIGAPMAAIGLSEVRQGSTMVADAFNETESNGINPLRTFAIENAGEKWGNVAYDGVSLATGIGALARQTPVVLGYADLMNRPVSIFGATTTVWNNAKYVPVTGFVLSKSIMQTNYSATMLYKTEVVVEDLNKGN
jgi:RHS repeat-associated protein